MNDFKSISDKIRSIRNLNSEQTACWIHNLIKTLPPRQDYFACEVGTYFGYMSSLMALSGIRTICIDHMRCGFCDIDPDSRSLYLDVIQNFINVGAYSSIVPMPMKSLDSIELLKVMKPTIGLLYLDGDHNHETVLKELQEFDRFIPVGGYVTGDDCTLFENTHEFHREITFNKQWSNGVEKSFIYNEHDYGAGVSTAVWRFFRNNNKYDVIQGIPPNQFGFKKIA